MTDVAVSQASADRSNPRAVDVAYRPLWIAVLFDVLAFGVGFGWDREWHKTHVFEDFLSPPHIFIYTMHLLATMTLAYVAFSPSLRAVFGATFRLPPLPFPVPGPIALAGGGFVVTGLAGFFDGLWHTAFGLRLSSGTRSRRTLATSSGARRRGRRRTGSGTRRSTTRSRCATARRSSSWACISRPTRSRTPAWPVRSARAQRT